MRGFYRSAQSGLDAKLDWPEALGGPPTPCAASALFPRLGDIARQGLASAGVEPSDSDALIDCVLERVERGQTGAGWQRARLAAAERERDRGSAFARMFEDYLAHSEEGEPVHRWRLP